MGLKKKWYMYGVVKKSYLCYTINVMEQPLWQKQKEALAFAKYRADKGKGVALFCACGTGKTRISVHWLEELIATKKAKLIYIVGPLTALHVWKINWADWATNPIPFIDLHESGSAGIRMAKKIADAGQPVICLVNYESAWRIGFKYILRRRGNETVKILEKVDTALNDLNWDVGILDESSFIKSPGAKISKFFRNKMAQKTKFRMIMSGSAYTKRPLDVWSQIAFACGEEIFSKTFMPFKMNYSVAHPYIRGAVVGYKNLADLVKRLAKVAVLVKKEDMFDLPPFVHETRMITLSPASQKIYNELRDEQIAEIEALEAEGITITANHIFTVIRKLSQITSGFIYPDEVVPGIKPEPIRLGTEKLDDLLSILNMRDDPTIVVTQYNEEEKILVEAIKKKFKFTPKVLNGSVKGNEARHNMILSASNDPVFIVKESVGARGVDFKFADMTIFYSHSTNTEAYEQILSRNHRGGQTKSITYIHLLCQNTFDIRIMSILERDLNLAASIERDWRKLF